MIDHTHTATELQRSVGTASIVISNLSKGSYTRKRLEESNELLLGLADWHLQEAQKPCTKNEAETLLASSCEALREFLIATIQAGNDEASYRDLAALVNDADNYFIDTLARADSNHGWTPATSPPDADLAVTVFTETGTIHQASFDNESGYWSDAIYGHGISNVTHWMDLIYPGVELTPTNLQKAATRALQPAQ